jgi:predicted RNA-binding Zn-ribbon protein involved in translation (DUF1610 family)
VRLPEGAVRRPRKAARPRRGAVLCPRCGSHRVAADLGFIDGARYLCKDCGFRGALVVTGLSPEVPPDRSKDVKP